MKTSNSIDKNNVSKKYIFINTYLKIRSIFLSFFTKPLITFSYCGLTLPPFDPTFPYISRFT